MDDEWDRDNFDPEPKVPSAVDKWEGEDEDDDVKDNWEDDEEEKEEKKDVEKQEDDVTSKAVQVKKSKKTLSEKIEEKERLAKEELAKKMQAKKNRVLDDDDDEEVKKELTPEERQAEKLRRQKLQEEADLKLALETFESPSDESESESSGCKSSATGVSAQPSATGLDGTPSTEEEFAEYQKLLISKLDALSKSTYFPDFAEEIVRNISINLPLASLKKLKLVTEAICTEKVKIEKGDKAKKKGKGKAQLRLEGNTNLMNEYSAYKDLDDYDDFM
ncbi:eukaryotic translation initiation factor 3 subunit J isoform X1 [Ischnura elegans]|uniref:eukaryotic translation initiation factor 3 subunit J isoform X1 n=1 Tax=Ischnura elegans TaxID=197161 RepID=UPI001ED8AFF5|nr:eukaryotic translation initiation factor 3 subunit J isoform X1 [Ischnura elegans]